MKRVDPQVLVQVYLRSGAMVAVTVYTEESAEECADRLREELADLGNDGGIYQLVNAVFQIAEISAVEVL